MSWERAGSALRVDPDRRASGGPRNEWCVVRVLLTPTIQKAHHDHAEHSRGAPFRSGLSLAVIGVVSALAGNAVGAALGTPG